MTLLHNDCQQSDTRTEKSYCLAFCIKILKIYTEFDVKEAGSKPV